MTKGLTVGFKISTLPLSSSIHLRSPPLGPLGQQIYIKICHVGYQLAPTSHVKPIHQHVSSNNCTDWNPRQFENSEIKRKKKAARSTVWRESSVHRKSSLSLSLVKFDLRFIFIHSHLKRKINKAHSFFGNDLGNCSPQNHFGIILF